MATMAENVIAAGSENCPPMLKKGMYDSWKTRIILYIKGKENGEMLIDSIEDGPVQLKLEITAKDNNAVNILLLGLPVDIYTLINHDRTAKEIWDRVKELMEGTEMTKQEREPMLYDEFDKFISQPEESIYSYYLRYAKLINDINMIPMFMSNMQINTKFLNHLQPEWSRFVTAAKQARDLHIVKFDQLYAFLKHNEKDAKEISSHKNQLRTSSNLRTQATIQNGQVMVQNVQGRHSKGYAGNAKKSQATGARVVNTVRDAGANQPRIIRCYNCRGEGHISKQCTVKKMVKDFEWFKDKILEENDDCDDLQLHTTTNFNADHVDAYDSDCDDQATTSVIFMASLSSAGLLNDDTITSTYDSNTFSEAEYIEHILSNKDLYDEPMSDSNVISYADYMAIIENDVAQNVPSSVQNDDTMLSAIEQIKSQVEQCTMGLNNEVKEMKDIFKQMEDEVDQCSVAKKCFEIEKKQLLINKDRLLEENISCDIMCTFLHSLNKVDNCGKCKSLDIINDLKAQLQDKSFVVTELKNQLALLKGKSQVTQCESPDFDYRILKIEDENIVSYTNASGSKPGNNTKNDKIQRPLRRSKKNKVEAQPRKSKSSSNKNNYVSDYNANIKNVALSKNSANVCLSCNNVYFLEIMMLVLLNISKMSKKRKKAKSVKQKEKLEWKPTGRIFKTVVAPLGKNFTTTVILVDEPCPKLSLRYAKAKESLSRSFLNFEIHPFKLHDFGLKRMLSNEELPS
ncbi:retrovirus-related pol polyprotein from transposon TNT 1-94 [Tanacetum coccineum]